MGISCEQRAFNRLQVLSLSSTEGVVSSSAPTKGSLGCMVPSRRGLRIHVEVSAHKDLNGTNPFNSHAAAAHCPNTVHATKARPPRHDLDPKALTN